MFSVVVATTADRMSRHPEKLKDDTDHHKDDAYGHQDRKGCNDPEDQKDYPKNDHVYHLMCGDASTSGGREAPR
jgi:hypothetical protein